MLDAARGPDETHSGAPSKETRRRRRDSGVEFVRRTYREFRDDNLADAASALTYYAVLSIFSALMGLVVVVGLVADPSTITRELTALVKSIGPPSAASTLREPIHSLAQRHSTAGILLVINLGSAVWTASGYVGAFMRVSNTIYEVGEGRPASKLRPVQILVTLMTVVLVTLILVGLILTGPIARRVGEAVGVSATTVAVWEVAKWPVMIAVVTFIIAVLHYSAPNAKLRGLGSIVPGTLLAVTVWLVASVGFAVYVAYFDSYNNVYGALGVIVGLLVALWFINLAVLVGAEVNAEGERTRQMRNHTPGAERRIQLEERVAPETTSAEADRLS